MKIAEILVESQDTVSVVRQHLPWFVDQVKLKSVPRIRLLREPTGTAFGGFDMESEQINLVVGDRHPIDVLRTLAHELVHARQRERDELSPGDGATGSAAENQANAEAGVLMRDFGEQHPEFFELNESKEFYYKEL